MGDGHSDQMFDVTISLPNGRELDDEEVRDALFQGLPYVDTGDAIQVFEVTPDPSEPERKVVRALAEHLERVLDAANRRASELLEQASKYERLNQPAVARETMDEHYKPLRAAIDALTEGAQRGP